MTLDIWVHGTTYTEAYAAAKEWAESEPKFRFVRIDALTLRSGMSDDWTATVVLEEIETNADQPSLWGVA